MKALFLILLFSTCLLNNTFAQKLSPDKFINQIKKDDNAQAFTIPGWLIRMGGKFAIKNDDMDIKEQEMIKELTSNIKKLRFVVSEFAPDNYAEKLLALNNYLNDNAYDSLIKVRSEGENINFWAKVNGQKIKRMVISIIGEDQETVFFNIKTNLDMDKLKQMEFFKKWNSI